MRNLTVKDIVNQCKGNLVYGDLNKECINFSTDTRKIKKDDVYIALKGETFDGNNFYKQALELGATVCILQNIEIDEDTKDKYKNASIIIVEDTLKALQQIAKFKRSLYNIPVIAITGSVGKTSTKDAIAAVVSEKYNVLKTEGNYNNHIGVPLTILRLKDHDALVVEMGMNNLGEISILTDIAKPTIAVITNIGTAHIGNLGSRENILKAKLEILEALDKSGCIIINNDNDMLHNWSKTNKKYRAITFGIENESDIMAKDIEISSFKSEYKINYKNSNYKIDVPVPGTPFIYNSLSAICVGNELGIDFEKIVTGIQKIQLTKNRMEIEKIKNITIINDCYNANYDSMKAGIESLKKMEGNKKIAVLGDMLELGEYAKELHCKVGEEVAKNNIDILITVGSESKNIAETAISCGMSNQSIYALDTNEQAIKKINELKEPGDCILIKASNGMKFIEIVEKLKEEK